MNPSQAVSECIADPLFGKGNTAVGAALEWRDLAFLRGRNRDQLCIGSVLDV